MGEVLKMDNLRLAAVKQTKERRIKKRAFIEKAERSFSRFIADYANDAQAFQVIFTERVLFSPRIFDASQDGYLMALVLQSPRKIKSHQLSSGRVLRRQSVYNLQNTHFCFGPQPATDPKKLVKS